MKWPASVPAGTAGEFFSVVVYFLSALLNSHPVFAPHMAQLVMLTFELCNRHWGWPSGTVCVLSPACRGFKTDCNGLFYFRACFNSRDSYVDFL